MMVDSFDDDGGVSSSYDVPVKEDLDHEMGVILRWIVDCEIMVARLHSMDARLQASTCPKMK